MDEVFHFFFQYRDQESFFQLNLWLYGFMLKLVPCLVLTVFTASLIRAMTQVQENTFH